MSMKWRYRPINQVGWVTLEIRFSFWLLSVFSSFRDLEKKKKLQSFSLLLIIIWFWGMPVWLDDQLLPYFANWTDSFILWQPQVSSASVNLTTEVAIVWPVSEAKLTPNWEQQLGETLAKHLTNCGFNSNIRGKHFKFHYRQQFIGSYFFFVAHIWVWISFYLFENCMLGKKFHG